MKHLPALCLSFTFLILICCGHKSAEKGLEKTTPQEVSIQSDLPAFEITFADGNKTSVKALKGKVALVLFQPDCDHCQREAEQIQANLSGFKDYTLYFISSSTISEITKFAKDYKLSGLSNVVFARTEAQNIVAAFGPIEAPSIYLYNKDGGLIESFNGEVAIEVVLKYI